MSESDRDLVILVADADMENGLDGLLQRPASLEIRPIQWKIFRHSGKDPGCLRTCHEFLRPFASQYARALVFFDREGCGAEENSREALEQQAQDRLASNGWGDRAAAVVFEPELESWFWAGSPHLEGILGWKDSPHPLRAWLEARQLWATGAAKPHRPKEALEAALREVRIPRSSSIYRQAATMVGLRGCTDPSFLRFRKILKEWFGA